jgi:hypothetical protein
VSVVLDFVERLFNEVQHPDIAEVSQYDGNTGRAVEVVYQSQAKAFIWPVTDTVTATPAELPAELPEYKFRALYALKLLCDLLDAVKPDGWRWRTVSVDGTDLAPCGLQVWVAGETTLLRFTSASTPLPKDSDPQQWAGWRLPTNLSVG